MIRAMRAEDRAAVLDMMRVFYASEAVFTNGSEEIFASDFAACVGDSPYLAGYVFTEGEETVGYAMIAKSFSTEFGKPCNWIEDIYIREAYRGKGIGTAFFAFLEENYTDCIFRLEVEKENTRALAVYEKCGFSELPYMEMKK